MTKTNNNNIKIIFIVVLCLTYLTLTILLTLSEKTTFSDYEKRPTKKFPTFSLEALKSNEFLKNIDDFLIDTIPFRSIFLDKTNYLRNLKGFKQDIEVGILAEMLKANNDATVVEDASINVLNNTSDENVSNTTDENAGGPIVIGYDEQDYVEYENPTLSTITNGLVLIGDGKTIRAMYGMGAFADQTKPYADILKEYKDTFPYINFYTMIIPTSDAYYAPSNCFYYKKSVIDAMNYLSSALDPRIKQVDVYHALLPHVREDIYLRTDHHWSPLGAYYATEAFAKLAGVDYKSLDYYDKHSYDQYYGSLYQRAGLTELKDFRETFTYYTPNNIKYDTYQSVVKVDSNQEPESQEPFKPSKFFVDYFLGTPSSYLAFMGGDAVTTFVNMPDNHTGRNLLIFKDSYGNAIPSCLFYSFDNIHVIDYRYFFFNIRDYIKTNNITDILFANCITACTKITGYKYYSKILNSNQPQENQLEGEN